jgi:hypothetical protein
MFNEPSPAPQSGVSQVLNRSLGHKHEARVEVAVSGQRSSLLRCGIYRGAVKSFIAPASRVLQSVAATNFLALQVLGQYYKSSHYCNYYCNILI